MMPTTDDQLIALLKAAGLQAPASSSAPASSIPSPSDSMDGSAQGQQTLSALDRLSAGAKLTDPTKPSSPLQARLDSINTDYNPKGIRAYIDQSGTPTFTNLGDDGKQLVRVSAGASGSNPLAGPAQTTVDNSIGSILAQMRSTTDPDAMRGLQSVLNEAVAVQGAKLNQEAQSFAQNKLGIPALEKALQDNVALDHNASDYVPGAGDSHITAGIRQQLDAARGYADTEAKRYLSTNVSAAQLTAAEKNAQAETNRLTKLSDKKDLIDTNLTLRADARDQAKQDALEQAAQGITDSQKDALKVLDPRLVGADDAAYAATLLANAKNKHFLEAVQAPDAELPMLAISGNAQANAVLAAKEQAATGRDPAVTQARLAAIRSIMNSPTDIKKGFEMVYPGNSKEDKQLRDAKLTEFNAKAIGTKEAKDAQFTEKFNIAKQIEQQRVATTFRADVGTWQNPDQRVQWALKKAKDTTGNASMQNVMDAYLDGATGPTATALVTSFITQMKSSAQKDSKSLFGMIDYNNVANELQRYQIKKVKDQLISSISPPIIGPAISAYKNYLSENR